MVEQFSSRGESLFSLGQPLERASSTRNKDEEFVFYLSFPLKI